MGFPVDGFPRMAMVLRATGIRIEELRELSQHSLVQYRLPFTGELVPLLQIAPSKTDAERLLVVSPELVDVLAAIPYEPWPSWSSEVKAAGYS